MARSKNTWSARWQTAGTRIVPGGLRVVDLTALINEDGPHHKRLIQIDLSPEMARNLAESLLRNADEADDYNSRRGG